MSKNKNIAKGLMITTLAAGAAGNVLANVAGAAPAGKVKARVVMVKGGDTPWSIAKEAYPHSDPRELAYEITQHEPQDSAHADGLIQPGDEIILPADSKKGKTVEVDISKTHIPSDIGSKALSDLQKP